MIKKNLKRTVLISGATSGIGLAAMERFLEEGFAVSGFAPTEAEVLEAQKNLSKKFAAEDFLLSVGDVTNKKSLIVVLKKTKQKFGKIDILINNAGLGYFFSITEYDSEKFQKMLDVNLKGAALLTKLTLPHIPQYGQIINIVSEASRLSKPKSEFYAATKFAMIGFSEGLRKELQPRKIKVTTVCPRMVWTNFWEKKELRRRKKEIWGGKIPTMLSTEDVANTIFFTASMPHSAVVEDVLLKPF